MRRITIKPRLIEKRDELIRQLRIDGFFIDEIGEIFRLQKSRVSQILNQRSGPDKNKQKNTYEV